MILGSVPKVLRITLSILTGSMISMGSIQTSMGIGSSFTDCGLGCSRLSRISIWMI